MNFKIDNINYKRIESPAFVLELEKLKENLSLIRSIAIEADVEIILALKAFAFWPVFPFIRQYLDGATASSLHEARLIFEEMGTKAHTYAPVFLPKEFDEIVKYSSHLTFNSIDQFNHYYPEVQRLDPKVSCGIRVNPEYSEVAVDLYNPANPGSRLGMAPNHFEHGLPDGVEGLHFHILCESTSYELENVLKVFENQFGHLLPQLKWVNFGGGHLMTRKGYDTGHLIQILQQFKRKYPLKVILEPGSAIVWDTGPLLSTVLDIVENRGIKTAMVDVSFTAHMPDTLEMPYRPRIRSASDPPKVGQFEYQIGGISCLAGDYMEKYGFKEALKGGRSVIF